MVKEDGNKIALKNAAVILMKDEYSRQDMISFKNSDYE
jgi:hypothetical protein